ncbi:hypothetical protein X975_26052, partial [Stegodyphus mimosarum]
MGIRVSRTNLRGIFYTGAPHKSQIKKMYPIYIPT